MNPRIKELMNQANEYALNKSNEEVDEEDFDYSFDDNFKSKFAELLIQECAKICDELQNVPATEPRHCAEDIRTLFGVEE
jgi:hypothetical protein